MHADPRIAEFIEKASAAGVPHESLVGVLTARGWPEKEIYNALADHYRRLTGVDVPRRAGAGASAKEAFFYLLIFSTLATWTTGLGVLAFALIDRWIADPLFFGYQQTYDTSTIAWSLAALIVAFPLYLLLSRAMASEAVQHPESLDSSIRNWLTYMALVIAACIFMGDLIAVLTYLLRGEFTSRFFAKSFVVIVLSGGVFFYYFGGIRKTDVSPAKPGRDRLMTGVSSAVVALMVFLGFWQLGSPGTQREFRADAQRIQQLYLLSTEVKDYWASHASQLPSSVDQFPGNPHLADPMTHVPYEYHPKQASQYELCATFVRSSDHRDNPLRPNPWSHLAGHYCFPLDASTMTQLPQPYPID